MRGEERYVGGKGREGGRLVGGVGGKGKVREGKGGPGRGRGRKVMKGVK